VFIRLQVALDKLLAQNPVISALRKPGAFLEVALPFCCLGHPVEAGMYGDLQGIVGKSLKEIDGLESKVLENAPSPGETCTD